MELRGLVHNGVLDQALVADNEIVREPLERSRRRESDEFALEWLSVFRDRIDEPAQRHSPMVLDVGRDLGDAAVFEPQPDRSHSRQAVGTALADEGSDPLGVLDRRRGPELDVEGDERRAGADEHGAGGGMQPGRSEVRHKLAAFDPCLECRRPAAAELGAAPSAGENPVQEHRQLELLAEPVGEHERLGTRRPSVLLSEEHDRGDVERADAWVDAVVGADVDRRGRHVRGRGDRGRELAGPPGDREHGAVVVGIRMNAEHREPERGRDRLDHGVVPSLRDVRHGEKRGHGEADHKSRGRPRTAAVAPHALTYDRGVSDSFDELTAFLRIPSISADPEHRADVWRAGEWVCEFIREGGGDCELVDWHGQPLAVGELRASSGPEQAPTVLCYGHFDVQPPDPLELWESPPFEPEIRGEYVYARGAADDKGPLYALLRGARELAQAGELPVNVRFACDGEEETGGHSIVEFVEADERGADVAVIFDTVMIGRGRPSFGVTARGVAYFHVTVRTGERDLHSGLYGGVALNAAHVLTQALGTVLAADGRLVEPLRAGILAPAPDELETWRSLPAGADALAEQGARPMDARAADEFYLRTLAEPSLDINGIESGSPHLIKTVLPVEAVANVSIRLAPGQDVAEISAAFTRLLGDAVPPGSELDVELLSSAAPAVVPPDAHAVTLGLDAFERALGVRPPLIRFSGTLPIMSALTEKGIPTIVTGFALPNGNIHSPNERLLAEYVPQGIATARELFRSLGRLRPSA